jgi:membrane associated rhomboid family serine protease
MNRNTLFILRFVGLLWLVKLVEIFLGISFAGLGIFPRSVFGLTGVLLAPLLHGDVIHLLSNTVLLLVLGTVMFWLYPGVAVSVFFYCYFVTGVLVWIFGRTSIHIGASGLLYGIALFLMTIGLFKKDPKSIFVSVAVVFFYSSILWGVLPVDPRISFESHLMGALVGIGCASSFSRSHYLYR